MTLVTFNKKPEPTVRYYATNLAVGKTFKVASHNAKGAVYMIVHDTVDGGFKQLELVTGKIYPLTTSPIELVEVEVTINDYCPDIYRNCENVIDNLPF